MENARCPTRYSHRRSVTFLLTAVTGTVGLSSSDGINSTHNCPQSHHVIPEHLICVYTFFLNQHLQFRSCVHANDRRKSLFVKLCQTFILNVAESRDEMQACHFFDTLAYGFSSQQFFCVLSCALDTVSFVVLRESSSRI